MINESQLAAWEGFWWSQRPKGAPGWGMLLGPPGVVRSCWEVAQSCALCHRAALHPAAINTFICVNMLNQTPTSERKEKRHASFFPLSKQASNLSDAVICLHAVLFWDTCNFALMNDTH